MLLRTRLHVNAKLAYCDNLPHGSFIPCIHEPLTATQRQRLAYDRTHKTKHFFLIPTIFKMAPSLTSKNKETTIDF